MISTPRAAVVDTSLLHIAALGPVQHTAYRIFIDTERSKEDERDTSPPGRYRGPTRG
jgi:hypothetical protein